MSDQRCCFVRQVRMLPALAPVANKETLPPVHVSEAPGMGAEEGIGVRAWCRPGWTLPGMRLDRPLQGGTAIVKDLDLTAVNRARFDLLGCQSLSDPARRRDRAETRAQRRPPPRAPPAPPAAPDSQRHGGGSWRASRPGERQWR